MTTTAKIQQSRAIAAYTLRALWRRVDWQSIPADRRRNIATELTDALVPLVISTRSCRAFFQSFCQRFEIAPAGGAYERAGEQRVSEAAYVLLPERFVPAMTPTMPHSMAVDGIACLRWDAAVDAIDFEGLRIALVDGAPMISTFVTAQPMDGEDKLFDDHALGATGGVWTAALPTRIVTPRAFRTVWTLTSPLAHGHDTSSGNVVLFRRERTVDPTTGEQTLRPMMSGNAVRGMWRDLIMLRLLALVGLTSREIPPKVAHALLAGGSIDKGADGAKVNVAARRLARERCPAWDLFAGVLDEQIMRGLLRVHDVVLICRENHWILWEMLAPTRDGKPMSREEFRAALLPADDLTQLRLGTRMAHREIEDAGGVQMIFNTEVLLPGAQMVHSFQLIGDGSGVSDLARSCMADMLAEFQDNAFAGAKNAAGLGRIAFDPYIPGDGEAPLPSRDLYLAWVAEHRDEIRAWLLRAQTEEGADDAPKKAARARGKKGGDTASDTGSF